ncbi:MAG TPA: tRNA (adenosine(37)-N6)-threonylcarbamoyltransferase complex ATPase subunit type 1 TsaE [Quisquiliibacterium sp.]|nr:tRNA (adenosine(37)-N6)-threonylcarbamoyltransferase complex ATPase subunit type 1 TsaE [Quisquiliibacterium sp.]
MQPPAPELELLLADETATSALAGAMAGCIGPGFVLYLSGDLGAGKTAFTRALLRALGHTGRVRSPTFTLAESYNLPNFELYHFDFYRFSADDEWRDLGFDELLGGAGAAVIEWPELGGPSLPDPDLGLRLEAAVDAAGTPDTQRLARLRAGTDRGRRCLTRIADAALSGRLAGVSSRAASPEPPSR